MLGVGALLTTARTSSIRVVVGRAVSLTFFTIGIVLMPQSTYGYRRCILDIPSQHDSFCMNMLFIAHRCRSGGAAAYRSSHSENCEWA